MNWKRSFCQLVKRILKLLYNIKNVSDKEDVIEMLRIVVKEVEEANKLAKELDPKARELWQANRMSSFLLEQSMSSKEFPGIRETVVGDLDAWINTLRAFGVQDQEMKKLLTIRRQYEQQ